MFSLAGISGFLSWLPLLPKQILALNFLSDLPALTISTDRVDEQQLQQPQKWDIQLIKRFMVLFGIQSSLFDFLTFALLLWYFKVTETSFQTSWFLESVLTEIMVLLILRTRGSIFKSQPSTALLVTCLLTLVTAIALPFQSLGSVIGLQPLPLPLLFSMTGIALFYGLLLETTKKRFFQAYERKTS
jgi:Mg2+-importing ATPase